MTACFYVEWLRCGIRLRGASHFEWSIEGEVKNFFNEINLKLPAHLQSDKVGRNVDILSVYSMTTSSATKEQMRGVFER
jgi:hypothetical protein